MITARARTRPAPGGNAARTHTRPAGGQTRLPWWAAVLPVLAFAVLLGPLLGGGEANAAEGRAGVYVLAQVLERVEQALLG